MTGAIMIKQERERGHNMAFEQWTTDDLDAYIWSHGDVCPPPQGMMTRVSRKYLVLVVVCLVGMGLFVGGYVYHSSRPRAELSADVLRRNFIYDSSQGAMTVRVVPTETVKGTGGGHSMNEKYDIHERDKQTGKERDVSVGESLERVKDYCEGFDERFPRFEHTPKKRKEEPSDDI